MQHNMNNISTFQFEGYKITKSFIEVIQPGDDNLEIEFEMSGQVFKEKGIYNLTLTTIVKNHTNTVNVNVVAVGKFSFGKGVDFNSDNLPSLFYTNAPALLFPYVRAYVSTLTNLSGIKPITLPTLNLTDLGKTLKEKTTIQ